MVTSALDRLVLIDTSIWIHYFRLILPSRDGFILKN
ncbi:MAG: hypothetical protein DDT24_00691 [Chloroflexi bacterium]|nr:hypothetical protein [Chloroflexota bacterium]